ncbi:MAG: Dihydropteroate synthase [Flavipsychrobacter sp.]|nr:Dihydropteroate synthase [Flavipsychrobacter sp.]
MSILHSKGRVLDISSPVVMGILNATPDSFYNKGEGSDIDGLLRNAEKMLKDGAAILDIGGASTKPGQELINADEELQRVLPAVAVIRHHFPEAWLSIDTYNAKTAREAVGAGIDIVNDVSSGAFDISMLQTVAALNVPYIAMHMQGTPQTMQADPQYGDVVAEVKQYLSEVCDRCKEAGISEVIIDPGFGFGKTVQHNFALLRSLETFKTLDRPILAGVSRKSLICKVLKVNPSHALNGTTALNMVALQNGADILRVHDVKEAMEVIALYRKLKG